MTSETPEGHACVSGQTKVNLADGTCLTVAELYKTQKNLQNHRIYGFDSDCQNVRPCDYSHIQKKIGGKKQCIKIVTLDGSSLICTPDHQIKVFHSNSGCIDFVEAKDLSDRHSIISTQLNPIAIDYNAYIHFPSIFPRKFQGKHRGSTAQFALVFTRLAGLYFGDRTANSDDITFDLHTEDDFNSVWMDCEMVIKALSIMPCHIFTDCGADRQTGLKWYKICLPSGLSNLLKAAVPHFKWPEFMISSKYSREIKKHFMNGYLSSKNHLFHINYDGLIELNFPIMRTQIQTTRYPTALFDFKQLEYATEYFKDCILIMNAILGSNSLSISIHNIIKLDSNPKYLFYQFVGDEISVVDFNKALSPCYSCVERMQYLCFLSYTNFLNQQSDFTSVDSFTKYLNLICANKWFLDRHPDMNDWNRFICVPFKQKIDVDDEEVYDVVNSELGSFTANGMLVSNCGIVKNLALTATVSLASNSSSLMSILIDNNVVFLQDFDLNKQSAHFNWSKVFLNGNWIGIHNSAKTLGQNLRLLRRKGIIAIETSICVDYAGSFIRITNDVGRLMRPLLIVENHKLLLTQDHLHKLKDDSNYGWSNLIEEGIVETIDTLEEGFCFIAMTKENLLDSKVDWTHAEIHPSLMFGVCASTIVFPDANQAPRNVYSSSMTKHSMGVYASNYQDRFDISHTLWYPQKPLVKTDAMNQLECDNLPAGCNTIVAIALYGGYNQEDSIIMKQSSIDRGLFRSFANRTYQDDESKYNADQVEEFCKPDKNITVGTSSQLNYEKLDNDGFVYPYSHCDSSDVIIGKTTSLTITNEMRESKQNLSTKLTKRDKSTSIRATESGVVQKVLISNALDGSRITKVNVQSSCIPEMGDKFSSRHGQKGTIGFTMSEADMPWNSDGISPDLIINSHCIPRFV